MQPHVNRPVLRRLGLALALIMLFLIGWLDLGLGLTSYEYNGVGWWLLALAGAASTIWLRRHPQDSTTLPKVATAFGAVSLLTTFLMFAHGPFYSTWGLTESFAMLGILYVVARRAAPGGAVVAAVTVVAAIGFAPLRSATSSDYIIFGLLQTLAAAAVLGAGFYVRSIAGSRQRAMDAVRAEQRAEFARDLHDFIAHHVTGIVVQAQGAKFVAEQDPQRVLLALEQIEHAGAETMASMRRMVGVLRDPDSKPDAPLAPVAGVTDLPALLEQFNGAGRTLARLHLDGSADGLVVEVSSSAYRVVMEALTNIRQHAPHARVADVWIRRTPEWLLVRVANDGVPPPKAAMPRDRPGYGLVGLAERVHAVGGRITSGPGIDNGWVVDAAFPIDTKLDGKLDTKLDTKGTA